MHVHMNSYEEGLAGQAFFKLSIPLQDLLVYAV